MNPRANLAVVMDPVIGVCVYLLKHKGAVIYVGCTKRLSQRLKNHRATKSFDTTVVIFFGEEDEWGPGIGERAARSLERQLIRELQPPLNRMGIDPHSARLKHEQRLAEVEALAEQLVQKIREVRHG